jgi:hypothetical protein
MKWTYRAKFVMHFSGKSGSWPALNSCHSQVPRHLAANEEGGGMATDLFLPADGLRLLGQHGGGGYDGRRFLVGRSDGEVIALPLLAYLIMAAIAEGGVDGGWSADQIAARVGTASGQGLTAGTVRSLVAGKLAPLGLIAAGGADRPADAAGPEPPPGRMKLPPGLRIRGGPTRQAAAGAADRVLSRPIGGGVGRLLLPRRRRRWALAVGGAAVLVCVAATAPIMAETGTGETGRIRSAPASASASASFGAGVVRVDVRAIAPAVPAAVRTQLAAERAALASAGRQLLGNKNIQVSPSARAVLADGRVDARLLAILSLLSAQLPVRLLGFIGAPGAGSGMPLRGAEIGVASPSARSAVVGLLDAQQGLYRPAAVTVIGGSQAEVAVRFGGPADLNISQP